jgi:hypothetical protein
MSGIRLGEDWTFTSKGAATQTYGVLAVRGAGKSNLAAVMAEEFHRLRFPFVVVDPVGSWWGLRSSADGKSPGLDVPIFGGRHGDVPLEKTGGALLADLVVDDRLSCVLDISEFSEGDKIRFLIDFAERLYRRNSEPLHLFLEEADDYIPQRPMREQARLLRAWENIVRRGRARGLGMTLITQRSAAINKNVLTQIETLFVLRTTSPQDRKAIEGWVAYHGERSDVLPTLPSLKSGEAWVWSPAWLGVLERIQVRRRSTFDSAATPKESKGARPAARLADVDLAKVRERMAETIERAKAEDPRALRAEISSLKRTVEIQAKQLAVKPAETPALPAKDLAAVEKAIERLAALADKMTGQIAPVLEASGALRNTLTAWQVKNPPLPHASPSFVPWKAEVAPGKRSPAPLIRENKADQDLGQGERVVLTAIAQHPRGVTREQLTVLTGYKKSSRNTYLQRLRSSGFIEEDAYRIRATPSGVRHLGDFEPLPTGPELASYWLQRLPEGERRILSLLLKSGRWPVDVESISEATGYSKSSRNSYLQRLGARGLIVKERGVVRPSEEIL